MSATLNAPNTALAVLPKSAVSTIVNADPNDILGKLHADLSAFEPDISTPEGRRRVASMAARVARDKMDMIRLGKGLTEVWRANTAAVNAECKIIEERMDTIKRQVRALLDEYEAQQAKRVEAHEQALADLVEHPDFGQTETAAELARRLDYLRTLPPRDWEEFAQRAARTIGLEIARTEGLHAAAVAREAAAAEAARIAAEQAEAARQEAARVQAAREAQIAAEAAAKAKLQAEQEAERQRQAAARQAEAAAQAIRDAAAEAHRKQAAEAEAERRRAATEQARVEQERQAAEARAAKAEADRAEAVRKAERDREAAAQQAEQDRLAAIEAERQRVADEAARAEAEADRRAADHVHKKRINREAAAVLASISGTKDGRDYAMTPDLAQAVLTWIALGKVPHVSVEY